MLDGDSTTERRQLQELSDRARIHEVTVRYARGVDRRDFAQVDACFAPDAFVDYGDFHRGDVPGLIAAMRSGLAGFPTTMHFLGNQLMELAADRAHVETYCVAHHRPAAAGRENDLLVLAVRYLDDMEVRDGAWRITRRAVVYDWRRVDAGVLQPSAR